MSDNRNIPGKYRWIGKKVLLIQIESELTVNLRKRFVDSGATFVYCDSISKAFMRYDGNLENFDLVIIDYSLNSNRHSPLLLYIRALNQDIPVLTLYLCYSPAMELELTRFGVNEYIPKPINVEEFGKLLDKYLQI